MLVPGDLGFSCMVLVLLSFPVIGFVVRYKWRRAAAKQEEIKRLLVLASEEAARAELEASAGYGTVSISSPYQCAICYSPTTTRCARCKAVRYCSGKCQIIHWRQGHKNDCHPAGPTLHINDEGSDSGQKATKEKQHEIRGTDFATEGSQSTETIAVEPPNSSYNSNVSHAKNDDLKDEFIANGERTPSATELCSATSELLSSEFESSSDALETTFDVDGKEPPSLVFTNSIKNTDGIFGQGKFAKQSFSDGEVQRESSSTSGSTIGGSDESPVSEPPTDSAGFRDGTLDYSRSSNGARHDSAQSRFKASDATSSDSGSIFRFSFNLSKDTVPPLHSESYESKVFASSDDHPTSLGKSRSIDDAAASSVKVRLDASKVRIQPLSSERSKHVVHETNGTLHKLKLGDLRASASSVTRENLSSMEATGGSNSEPSTSKGSKHLMGQNLHSFKSRQYVSASSRVFDPIPEGHSVRNVKSEKIDSNHSVPAVSSVMASNGLKTSVRKVVDQLKASKLSKHYPLGIGSDVSGRYNDKALFSYELFVKLYHWKKVELQPCGLVNCGNSCYANAVLQCLAFTPPLTAYFLQGLHSKACVKEEWCFTCEFESLILKAKEGNSPLSPARILSQLCNSGSHLGNGREEDAHEFLRYGIDNMQSVCLKEAGVNASGHVEEETTLMGLTFGGYLRSKIKCMKCQGKSERHERMMDLTVEIEGNIETLEEALRQFTRTEVLDGENKYQCSRCKSYEKAKKKLTVLEAPNVLTIALKRFQSGKFGKLNKSIRFPEILNLAPCMSGTSDKSPIYRLYGVVVHLDIMNAAFSGHYVCYVKNIQNKWFKIDDSMVKPVDLDRVLTKGAYMLLYSRCSPRAPRSIRNIIMSHDAKLKKKQAEAVPSRVHATNSKPRSPLSGPGRGDSIPHRRPENYPSWNPLDSPTSFESSYYSDETSENSSIFSYSDEGSCSTESTRDSTSTDDLSDYIFGDPIRSWNSPWNNQSDSDTSSSSSSSSSPFFSKETNMSQIGNRRQKDDLEVKGTGPFLYSDTSKQCRKLVSSSVSETDPERLGWGLNSNPFDSVNYGSSFRGSTRGRTD